METLVLDVVQADVVEIALLFFAASEVTGDADGVRRGALGFYRRDPFTSAAEVYVDDSGQPAAAVWAPLAVATAALAPARLCALMVAADFLLAPALALFAADAWVQATAAAAAACGRRAPSVVMVAPAAAAAAVDALAVPDHVRALAAARWPDALWHRWQQQQQQRARTSSWRVRGRTWPDAFEATLGDRAALEVAGLMFRAYGDANSRSVCMLPLPLQGWYGLLDAALRRPPREAPARGAAVAAVPPLTTARAVRLLAGFAEFLALLRLARTGDGPTRAARLAAVLAASAAAARGRCVCLPAAPRRRAAAAGAASTIAGAARPVSEPGAAVRATAGDAPAAALARHVSLPQLLDRSPPAAPPPRWGLRRGKSAAVGGLAVAAAAAAAGGATATMPRVGGGFALPFVPVALQRAAARRRRRAAAAAAAAARGAPSSRALRDGAIAMQRCAACGCRAALRLHRACVEWSHSRVVARVQRGAWLDCAGVGACGG
jgi:hypothetical protein